MGFINIGTICWVSPLTTWLFLQVDCHDYNNSGSHELIGSFQTTLAQIQQGSETYAVRLSAAAFNATVHNDSSKNGSVWLWRCRFQAEFECINSKKKAKKRGYKNSGVIIVKKCKVLWVKILLKYHKHNILYLWLQALAILCARHTVFFSDSEGVHLPGLHHGRLSD